MADQITIEEALVLVEFQFGLHKWQVRNIRGTVYGDVWGSVVGTIRGRHWKFIETPKEKLKRLIEEGADKAQLLEAFNQLEDN